VTSFIQKYILLAFCVYVEHLKWSPDATLESILVRHASGL
jgi:hypothetical protein